MLFIGIQLMAFPVQASRWQALSASRLAMADSRRSLASREDEDFGDVASLWSRCYPTDFFGNVLSRQWRQTLVDLLGSFFVTSVPSD